MEKPFHPNDIYHPNYKQMLQEHYKRVNKRLGVAAIPRIGVSRLETELSTIVDTKPVLPVISIVVPEVKPTPKMTEEEKETIRQGKYPIINEYNMPVAPKAVLPILCKAFDVPYHEIIGSGRLKHLVEIRAYIIQVLFIMYGETMPVTKIADAMCRDHSSIHNLIDIYQIDKSAKVYKKPLKRKYRKN